MGPVLLYKMGKQGSEGPSALFKVTQWRGEAGGGIRL